MAQPRSKYCVLLVCNSGYMPYATALVRQIKAMERSATDVLIASTDELSSDAIEAGAKYLHIDVEGFIAGLPSNDRLGNYCYWRLPAIDQAVRSYERVLYLDIDIYCAAPGIRALVDIPMGKRSVAAVSDVHLHYRSTRTILEYDLAGLDHAGYFNSGVLLVDAANWTASGAMDRLADACQRWPDALVRQDQSALNLAFYRDWLEISPVWNWQYSKRNAYAAVHAGPRLYHYTGERKLWSPEFERVVKSHWLHFQDLISNDGIEPRAEIENEMKALLRPSVWYRRALIKYLERFADDLSVIDHGMPDTET